MTNNYKKPKSEASFLKPQFETGEKLISYVGNDYTLDGYGEYLFVKSAYERFISENSGADPDLAQKVSGKLTLINAQQKNQQDKENLYRDCKTVVKFLMLKNSAYKVKKSKKIKRPLHIECLHNGETIIASKNKDDQIVDEFTVEVLKREFFAQRKEKAVKKEKPHDAINRFLYEKDLTPPEVCRATGMTRQDFYKYTNPKKTVKPSRNRIIRMAFGLRLTLEETKYLVSLYNIRSFPEEGSEKDRLVCVSLGKCSYDVFDRVYYEIFGEPYVLAKVEKKK